jgi:hypothetical protein
MKIPRCEDYSWFIVLVDARETGRPVRLLSRGRRAVDDRSEALPFCCESDAEWFLRRGPVPAGYRGYCEEIPPPPPAQAPAYRVQELFREPRDPDPE